MLKILFIAFMFVFIECKSFTSATTDNTFNCADDLQPNECKVKFGQHFESEALALQLKTASEIFENYINLTTQVKAELNDDTTTTNKNPYTKIIEENIRNLEITLKKLKIQKLEKNEQEKLIEIISNGMHEMEIDTKRPDIDKNITKHIKELFDKYAITSTLSKSVHTFLIELSHTWSEMFYNLRQKDLKEFPVYEQINVYMLGLRDEGRKAEKIAQFEQAKSLLYEEFHLQLFKEDNSFF